MQYIIMSDGKVQRWNNYNNTTKQTININGENFLQHTINLLHSKNEYNIMISSHVMLMEYCE